MPPAAIAVRLLPEGLGGSPSDALKQSDRNGDAQLDAWPAAAADVLAATDRNGDGGLDVAEFAAWRRAALP
jgi:hypothetical protein